MAASITDTIVGKASKVARMNYGKALNEENRLFIQTITFNSLPSPSFMIKKSIFWSGLWILLVIGFLFTEKQFSDSIKDVHN